MPTFTYKGIDRDGKAASGSVDAADRKAALRSLAASGVRPSSIETRADAASSAQETFEASHDYFGQKKKADDTPEKGRPKLFRLKKSNSSVAMGFLKNLLMLLQSGMPMGDSLRLLHSRVGDPQQKELAGALWKRISEGRTLSASMLEFPDCFNESHAQLVAAGEASGRLPVVLERVVSYLEENAQMRQKFIAGLAYPLFIVGFALIIVVVFLLFLLPIVRKMLESMGGHMQLFARVLIWVAEAMVTVGPWVLAAGVIAAVMLSNWRKTPRGRTVTDIWMLRMPILAPLYEHQHILQTTSLLSTLLESGVNTPEALRLVERTLSNTVLRAAYAAIRRMIQEGASLSAACRKMRIMPDIDVDILAVGENTGNISSSLKRIYEIHREAMSRSMAVLTVVLSTSALLVAFSIVAMLAMSIVMSVLDISHSLSFGH
ncbi:MAG: type II secretion system F family protein [Opitutales bacterium]|jgi:type II secretory pathway component PulF